MRILYIVTAFPRGPGDVITPWLLETIQKLRERQIEVEVLAPSYRGRRQEEYEGIRVHRFRYALSGVETLTHDQTTPDRLRERPYFAALLPGYLLAGSLAAARLTRRGDFDVVHVFWPLPHGLFGLVARRFSGVPLVSTFFGVELTWLGSQLRFLAPVVRAIIRRSDAVTVISSHTAAEVQRLAPGARVRPIPFGAATGTAPDKRRVIHDQAQPYRILFVGRLVERKGVQVLLRAMTGLNGGGAVRLTVAGDGPLRRELERLAAELDLEDRVEFTGRVTDGELRRLYDTSDLFVLPAVRDAKGDVEGLGVVLIEALLHGVPVVASDSGGIPDIVRDGETGLLVRPGDPGDLAAAIERAMANPDLTARLAAAGWDHVREHFSWERIVADLEALYLDVSGAGPRGSRR
ncbi:MAG: glycosyltransferase family 4 protein [Gemmatimonadota bacterium]